MVGVIYEASGAVIAGWALFHLALGRRSGLVGKILYFLTAAEAGAICVPASWHFPAPETVLPMMAITIVYQELFINYRGKHH